jgi:glycosyltransferase involved in cell wall biosynthesis
MAGERLCSSHTKKMAPVELAMQEQISAVANAQSAETHPIGVLRVLHLVDSLNIGGTENQMAGVALRMQQKGDRITVGCLRAEGPLLQVLQRAGIPVVEFRKEKTLLSVNGVRQLLHLMAFLGGRFDVVHAHDLWSTLLGVPAARLARVPVIISSRRYLADLEWYTPLRNRVVRFLYTLSTRVLVNSQAVRQQLVTRDQVAPEKVRVVYNAVDVERFTGLWRRKNTLLPMVAERSRVVAVLANMYSRVKGHDCLISAARIVCQSEPDVVFLLIGDGPERPRLEAQTRDAGLEKNIVFIGQRTDIPELLACCDLSVLPSDNEAFPNALVESMSSGLPVVATAVGGSKEIIENEVTGLLVPPGKPQELATAVLRLLRDPKLAKRLARAGRKDVQKRFSFDRLMAELDHLYKEPLGA